MVIPDFIENLAFLLITIVEGDFYFLGVPALSDAVLGRQFGYLRHLQELAPGAGEQDSLNHSRRT